MDEEMKEEMKRDLARAQRRLAKQRAKMSEAERVAYRAVRERMDELVESMNTALREHGGRCRCKICWELEHLHYMAEVLRSGVEGLLDSQLIKEEWSE